MVRARARFPLIALDRAAIEPAAPSWYGFLVGESRDLVAIHCVSERYDLDGYRVFRRDTVTAMTGRFPRRRLIEAALRLKELTPRAPAPLDLASMPAVVAAVDAAYPLVVIHRELVHPDECEIGRLRLHTEDTYVLDWLTPNAMWEVDRRRFRFDDITRIDFDSEYENTLAMVAAARGEPRPRRRPRPRPRAKTRKTR